MLSLNLMNPCNNLGSVFNNALFNPLSQPTNTAPTNDLNLEELTRLIGMNSPPTTETNTNLIPFPMNLLPQLAANLNQFPGMGNVPSLPSNNTLFRDALLLAKQQKGIAISPPVHKNTYHSKNGHNGENGNHNEAIVPSDDNEGWCRNKKYIQRVDNGYMCIVCKKVYGRYNSVSYHVTIYHRNPPIQCTEEGCAFSTREARYIHFHKYYRHGIALPQTIDLESRKCPFCRHVSKSPAMLEKHISRHVPEGSKNVKKPKCPKCNVVCESQMALFQHIKTHEQTDKFQCLVCSSTFATNDDLDKHKVSVHGLAVDGASLSEESGSALSPTSTSDDEPYHRDCTPSSTHTTSPF
uniref:C2H2-type domain-containing protein n=1 Tax=Rhabditophanes sp. KR3021 TaxID=114890 RepID=A0AC35U3D1_9BILA